MKNLVVDIGNTRTKVVVFYKGEIISKKAFLNTEVEKIVGTLKRCEVENGILSSTIAEHHFVSDFLKKQLSNFILLDHITPVPIKNHYSTPKTLGKDRLAAVVGAWEQFPKQNSLVIDAGTCITVDAIDEQGRYFGGSIHPGIDMRLDAMEYFTSKLPRPKRDAGFGLWGSTTITALRVGAQTGAVAEIEEFIRQYNQKYSTLNTIITGGDADFFVSNLKSKIFALPDLVPMGLNKILLYNVENDS